MLASGSELDSSGAAYVAKRKRSGVKREELSKALDVRYVWLVFMLLSTQR